MRVHRLLLLLLIITAPLLSRSQPYLENGLVAYWPFNGNANDYSGFGNDGYAFGVWSVPDHNLDPNQAYYFDGIASKINVLHDKFVTSYLTASFFIRLTDSLPVNFAMACSDFSVYTNGDSVGFIISLPSQKTAMGYSQISKWSHIVGTYDNNDIRLYVNGNLVDSVYHPGILHDMDWNMVMGGFGSNYWEGELDEIRIYNRVLTPSEIGQLWGYYSIEEAERFHLGNVWPQPCNSVLNIDLTGEPLEAINVYALDGRLLMHLDSPIQAGQQSLQISVADLPSGMYLLECQLAADRQVTKIMIAH